MLAQHPFLKFILPTKAFAAVKAGTKEWLAECPCGHKRHWGHHWGHWGQLRTLDKLLFDSHSIQLVSRVRS